MGHGWKFFRAGGVDQVLLQNGADVAHISELDQKLWVALAMPTRGTELDPKTADLLDTDKDGRIRPPELIAAVDRAKQAFTNLDVLAKGGDVVALSNIKDEELKKSVKKILQDLGKPEAQEIKLADVTETASKLAARPLNGDGVVVPESAPEGSPVRKLITDVIDTVGGVPDKGGKTGVDKAKLDQFLAEVKGFVEWDDKAIAGKTSVLPLGDGTKTAHAAVQAVAAKIDDYFARCRVVAFDPRAATAMNREEQEYVAIAKKDLSSDAADVGALPLARIEPGKPLPLGTGINPVWNDAVAKLRTDALVPLFGVERVVLTEAEWKSVRGKLDGYVKHLGAKPAGSVEKLGIERLREIHGGKVKDELADLIAQDKALEKEASDVEAVERAVRFQRDLHEVLTNTVTFSAFYGGKAALFQAGTLYLDARACRLTVEVTDAGKHAALAGLAGAYLAYCDITRPGGLKKQIVAVFTDGDRDNLMVGRNGVFYDRKGVDWDATITKIVDNPISVREAFWAPYKKFARMLEEQVSKRAAASEAESHAKVGSAASAVATADQTKAPPPPDPKAAPAQKKMDIGTVAAIGVALGSIGTFFGLLLGKFLDLGAWMPFGILAIILLISGPSMLLAYLKLRLRNLGPILDASGWAINTRAAVNVPFGASLTHVAVIPAGSERLLKDPFAEPKKRWPIVLIVGLFAFFVVLWWFGVLDTHMPELLRRFKTPAG